MDLATIEQNVGDLDVTQGFDLIFDLLAAYGMPKASITRLRNGSSNRSDRDDEVLWKGKVYYRDLSNDPAAPDPHVAIDEAAKEERVVKQQPRFLIVRRRNHLLAVDRKTADSLDIPLAKLGLNAAFFMPWAGVEKAQLETSHYADIKAAEKMARLYDEIRKVNDIEGEEQTHALNVFFTRLLFCFFAEDTGVFADGQVTKAIGSLTHQDGTDLDQFLGRLFETLNTPIEDRADLPSYFADFGYVNGSLFAQRAGIPKFSKAARSIILECAELDWSEISPDIFGSMMQAIADPDQRAGLGMHYTSVDNIMKVLRPLILDSLDEEIETAKGDVRLLQRLIERLSRIRVLDPACGSGNFLVVAYRELRLREMHVLDAIRATQVGTHGEGLFDVSRIDLSSFFGIELDDFACEVAKLSLWLAKHQMNARFAERFGAFPPLIPLSEAGSITCGNATRIDWLDVCPAVDGAEILICSNPPYQGGTRQTQDQTKDLLFALDDPGANKYLDYVAAWVFKAARYVQVTGARAGLVATNSICVGRQVSYLWPKIFEMGIELTFAHQSFEWTSQAKGQAGVTCVIVGLGRRDSLRGHRPITTERGVVQAEYINAYLVPDGHPIIVAERSTPLAELPPMVFGSMPRDGGGLVLTADAARDLLSDYPEAERFVLRYMGAEELTQGRTRFCIWVDDVDVDEAWAIPGLAERFEAVRRMRASSKASSTRQFADVPHRFVQRARQGKAAMIVPRATTKARRYVPIGYVGPDTVISDSALAVFGAEIWVFGLVQSYMHMTWLRGVGGRMRDHPRYSAELVYNTFPFPNLSAPSREAIGGCALEVLRWREEHLDRSLSELYAVGAMPQALVDAHEALDVAVEEALGAVGLESDAERLNFLLAAYARAVGQDLARA